MEKIKFPHPLILIVITGFLLYGRSLSFDYTNFDDNSLIQENQKFISDISNLPEAFRRSVFLNGSDVFYRPVETVWFMLNAQVGGTDLFVYHLSALLLHLLAVYLIFILLKKLNNSGEASLLLALIFLVHPLFSQAVAWVPGVVDILVAVFSISAFIFFLEFLKSQQRKYFVLHLLFFTLALYSKETAAGLVVVCLFYLHFIEKEKLVSYNKKVFLAGWIVIGVVWFLMRDAALQNQHQKGIGDMIFSVILNLPGFVPYLGKILFPFDLSVMPTMQDATFIFGIASAAILLGVIFMSKGKRKNWILFAVAWFIIFLLPTFISTSEFRIQQFYEHRMYLPMIGFLMLIAETDVVKNFSIQKIPDKIFAGVILLFFFILAFVHENVFKDTKNFLDNAIAYDPGSSLAHRNMGIYFQDLADQYQKKKMTNEKQEALKQAESEYQKALALNPHEKDLHNNLGVIYDSWNKKDLAEKEYTAETQTNPVNSQSFHNLGVLYAERNENEKAEVYFKKAIGIVPSSSSYQQLALLYKKMGRQQEYEKIVRMLQESTVSSRQSAEKQQPNANKVLQVDPITLGRQLMDQGKLPEAEQVFKKALAADSSNTKMLFNLGLVYYSEKHLSDAEIIWRKALTLDSTYTDAFNNLAICLAQQGKKSEAEIVMKKLISSNPNYTDGYFNLANFYARNGRESDALVYVNLLKKKGITKEQFQQRGIKLSDELEKLFDK